MRRLAASLTVWLALAAILVMAACGGDSDGDESGGDEGAAGTTTTVGESTDPACEGPPFTVDLRAANAFSDLEPFEDAQFEIIDTAAVKVTDAAYTMYFADYEIDREVIGTFETLHPGEGQTLITMFITVFNAEEEPPPIEVGEVIAAESEFGEHRFGLIVERGADMYNTSAGAEGEVEVLGLSDEEICVSIDYADYEENIVVNGERQDSPVQKRLIGTVSAEVTEM